MVKFALTHSGWLKAMNEEIDALKPNQTWDLVSPSSNTNIVDCKWIYEAKLKPYKNID